MRVLGIETSCDETGVAVYDTSAGLLAHALHSQVAMHRATAAWCPSSPRATTSGALVPLIEEVVGEAGIALADLDGIAYTEGPGLAGALLVGASVANALAYALASRSIGVHHLEGHLLSPLLADPRPEFPFVALLVSGGHSQLFDVDGRRASTACSATRWTTRPARRSTRPRSCWACPIPADPRSRSSPSRAAHGAVSLPRPMLALGRSRHELLRIEDGGAHARAQERGGEGTLDDARKADIAREFQRAVVDVLVAKALAALDATGLRHAGRGRRRRRESRVARAARADVAKRGAQRLLPRSRVLHRQRRDDRARGRAAVGFAGKGRRRVRGRPRWALGELAGPV